MIKIKFDNEISQKNIIKIKCKKLGQSTNIAKK